MSTSENSEMEAAAPVRRCGMCRTVLSCGARDGSIWPMDKSCQPQTERTVMNVGTRWRDRFAPFVRLNWKCLRCGHVHYGRWTEEKQ